jgi:hypothetical protein
MKRNVIFLALFIAAFLFPTVGSVSNADALGNYGCGNPDKKTHVNCLRGLLSSTPYGLTVQQSSPSKDGLGNYGCGNSNKIKHTNCLRRHLDQHGAHLAAGGNHGAAGSHSPGDISHCAALPPITRPQCEADAHGGPGNHPPVDISHCASMPPTTRPACEAAAHGMNNPGMGAPGMSGGHNDAPPIDPRSGQPFTRADEVKYQKYADECEATNGLLSEGSAQALVAEGFTRVQLDHLCKGGNPGMPPMGNSSD